ncbi:trypsin beta-like [Venturia canescens]|uniref:trypsin beta-like n=1 Tax=Venturia canescens TaxID=32260 RepID=UPI001C9CF223|nr:trypsin beta-like [Venturia canescens]
MIRFLALTSFFAAIALGRTSASGAIDYSKFPERSGKIVRGEETTVESVPWQVSLGLYIASSYEHICGGSIVSEFWILTAAHCILLPDKSRRGITNVVSGATRYKTDGTLHDIDLEIPHPEYAFLHDARVSFNDIGLVHVLQKFEFGATRQPVRLHDADSGSIEGMLARASGWGFTEKLPKQSSESLRAVQLSIVKKWQCDIYLSSELNRDMYGAGQICAYGDGRRSSCNGDSGGPVTVGSTLVGILSWVPSLKTCAFFGKPLGVTEVAHYRQWIWRTIHV